MTARVLIVDDLAPNVKLLEAKLANEYYEYESATSGMEALSKVKTFRPDIILLDVMMPEMDGFETCRRLKADPETSYIPVVMVTALSDISDRVQGLEAGADDFITKPINDLHLFARIKSLARVKLMLDELRMRDKTGSEFGLVKQAEDGNEDLSGARITVVNDDVVESRQLEQELTSKGFVVELIAPEQAVGHTSANPPDLCIVSTQIDGEEDGLRLCVHIRSQEASRHVPLLILVDQDDKQKLFKGLEMGINDYVLTPVDNNELIARCRTQIKRKHYQDALKSNYQASVSMAIIDQLTQLYNRRYLDAHLQNIFIEAQAKKTPLALMTLDIDHFKSVNDKPGWGHDVGDEVLKELAQRILNSFRNTDLATRPGGEEFIIVMPNTTLEQGQQLAERLRSTVEATHFPISADPGSANITISIGVAATNGTISSAEELIKKSDEAVFQAKENGRNQVVVAQ